MRRRNTRNYTAVDQIYNEGFETLISFVQKYFITKFNIIIGVAWRWNFIQKNIQTINSGANTVPAVHPLVVCVRIRDENMRAWC